MLLKTPNVFPGLTLNQFTLVIEKKQQKSGESWTVHLSIRLFLRQLRFIMKLNFNKMPKKDDMNRQPLVSLL